MASNISQLPLERRLGNMTKKGAGRSNNIIPFPNASAEHGGDHDSENPVDKFRDLYKSAQKDISTKDIKHDQIFGEAAEEVLADNEGNVDYELLEDENRRNKFIDKILEGYVAQASAKTGMKVKDEHDEDALLMAYMGQSATRLKQRMRQLGAALDKEQYGRLISEVKEELRGRLMETALADIRDKKDIEAVLRYTGMTGKVNPEKPVTPEEAKRLLLQYEAGELSKKYLKTQPWYLDEKRTHEHKEGHGHGSNVVDMSDHTKHNVPKYETKKHAA